MKEMEIEEKTDELLERLGFADERDTLVKNLPLGWKQKLAFSVSIFHEPKKSSLMNRPEELILLLAGSSGS